MPAKKQLAEKSENALLTEVDMSEYAGLGMEEATSDDFAIPFIVILQKNSPQVDETEGAYIEGARPGMIYNTVSGEMYDGRETGLFIIPVHFRKEIIEWVPRKKGGGLVEIHPAGSPIKNEAA